MQAGPPRGAERWYIKDGVMNDGRIVARQVRGYFDGGAFTRLSSYAVIKCTAHMPGPYTIPNVSSDMYCVFTNRTPATAMRGFGVTGVDFALECQMDKLARLVGMNPVEFRILNAYRDGDMKAHRRVAKNCALVECCQVAAEKANWPIREEFKRDVLARRRWRRSRRHASDSHGPPGPGCPICAAPATGLRAAGSSRPGSAAPGGAARAAATRARSACATTAIRATARGAAGRQPILIRHRHEEALIMAKHKGRGVASINYPIGMNLGGDPSQALVHSNPTGKFTVALSSIDLGQGMKSVTRQIAAETLGVPVEDVYVDTADSDTGPHCMGSFASRGTHRVGNAVIAAAKEARGVMLEAAAEELEVNADDLETDGKGNIHVRGAPQRSISTTDVAIAAQFKQGKTISGRGIFLIPPSDVDPETGEMTPVSCYAHACLVADVEVDDETGDVTVLEMNSAYELGRALNPKLVEQQLVGGAWMGMSHALYETTEPYYPNRDPRTGRLQRVSDARPRRYRPAQHRGARAPGARRPVRRQGPGRNVRQPGASRGCQCGV